jgi:hypothetical protein
VQQRNEGSLAATPGLRVSSRYFQEEKLERMTWFGEVAGIPVTALFSISAPARIIASLRYAPPPGTVAAKKRRPPLLSSFFLHSCYQGNHVSQCVRCMRFKKWGEHFGTSVDFSFWRNWEGLAVTASMIHRCSLFSWCSVVWCSVVRC